MSSLTPAPRTGTGHTSERRCHSRRWSRAIWLWAAGPAWLTRQPAPNARRQRPYLSGEHCEVSTDLLKCEGRCEGQTLRHVCTASFQHSDSCMQPKAYAPPCCHGRYLALGNDRNEFFELTTPLFVSSEGVYSLAVPGYKVTWLLLLLLQIPTCPPQYCLLSRLCRSLWK